METRDSWVATAANRGFEGDACNVHTHEQFAGSQMDKQSIAVGKNKGFPVTKRTQKQRPSHRKGAVENTKGSGNKVVRRKVNFVRDLIREVMGLAPYEKRVVGSLPPHLHVLFFFCSERELTFLLRVVEARKGEARFEGC
jgi:hypothetical protein